MSIAILTILRAISLAWCSSNSTCSAPFIFARGFVVSSLVWNFFETFAIAGMMHCTSTVIRSTRPVMIPSSWFVKPPAVGMPWRISTSFAVQHMPPRLMPSAPLLLA